MASPEEVMATEQTQEIGGKTYTLKPLSNADFGLISREIKSERGNPAAVAADLVKIATPEERERILDRAYEDSIRARHVTARELDEWVSSLPGFIFCFWLMLRPAHPEVTREGAGKLLEQLGEDEWAKIWDKTSGLPEGNLPSPA